MRNGITVISFLHGLAWSKLDNGTHKLLLKTLQNHYPARVAHVAVVSPSWWASARLSAFCPPPLLFPTLCASFPAQLAASWG
jgi:hypothetical protein